jgi:hypothetical protein
MWADRVLDRSIHENTIVLLTLESLASDLLFLQGAGKTAGGLSALWAQRRSMLLALVSAERIEFHTAPRSIRSFES